MNKVRRMFSIIFICVLMHLMISPMHGQSKKPASKFNRPFLYLNYNFVPDTLLINGEVPNPENIVPYSKTRYKLQYYGEKEKDYHIRARLFGSLPIDETVTLNSRVKVLKIKFRLDRSVLKNKEINPYEVLPLKHVVGQPSLVTHAGVKRLNYLTFAATYIPFALARSNGFKNDHTLAAITAGIFQSLHGVYVQHRRWHSDSGRYQAPNFGMNNKWGFNLSFASLDDKGKGSINDVRETELGRSTYNVAHTSIREFRDYGITFGLERYLSRSVFLNTNLTYSPTDAVVELADTVRYGATRIPHLFLLEEKFHSLTVDLNLNVTVLKVLHHELALGAGGYWGNGVKLSGEFPIKITASREEYDTVSTTYEFKRGGLSLNFIAKTQLSRHFGYHFRVSYLGGTSVTAVEEKKRYNNWNIHVGFSFR